MELIKADVCVIGAGSGGLSLASGAAQMGAKVVLIEAGEMGGDCLNSGCVPSKALLSAAKAAHAARSGAFMGVNAGPVTVDFSAAKDHVRRAIEAIAPHDSQERFESLGVTVIRATGRFVSPTEVEAGGQRIRARRFVIATGSRAAVPPVPGIETIPYLTNETIFELRGAPSHLIVMGGGPIGLEMAQAHARLGCKVTVVEAFAPLGRDDPEAAQVVLAALKAEGITIHAGEPVVRMRAADGGLEVVLGNGEVLAGSHLLVAAGRAPVLEPLNLAAAGVSYGPRGVTVGPNLRSVSNRRIYAVGDVAGGAQFTHAAGAHAGVVIRQILLGLPAKAATSVPWVTYTDPELAQAGLTEAQARHTFGARVVVLRSAFSGNDRAVTEGKATHGGFVKVMAVGGRPVGATIVGPQAGELIAFWALAIAQRTKLSAIAGVILPYPTLSESAKRVAGAYFSAKLFDNPRLKAVVRLVQRFVP